MEDRTGTGKYLCLLLRHHPEAAGITVDRHGWADVSQLVAAVSKTHPLTRQELEELVAQDSKQRYSYNSDHTKIRANQGHSIPVDLELPETEPPEVLYHGTVERFVPSIDRKGLVPGKRLYVHLSPDRETARQVGIRRGEPFLYEVFSGQMFREGYRFYRSVNGVWLTEAVPPRFLNKLGLQRNTDPRT